MVLDGSKFSCLCAWGPVASSRSALDEIIKSLAYLALLAVQAAFQHATTELLRWLTSDYGFDERTASMLMGQAVEYEIANVVDPHFTVVAKLRKAHLRAR